METSLWIIVGILILFSTLMLGVLVRLAYLRYQVDRDPMVWVRVGTLILMYVVLLFITLFSY